MSEHKDIWHILQIDDDEEDSFITRQMLSKSKGQIIQVDWVSTLDAGWAKLNDGHNGYYDAVLVDYDLGDRNGIEIIRQFSSSYPAPLILYTGRGGHEIDLEAQQAGATMFLTKQETNALLLERVIRYAIELKHSEQALQQSQQAVQQKNEMLVLLNEAAAELLAGAEPLTQLDEFLSRAGKAFGLEVYVQYNLSDDGTCLNLGKLSGFPDQYLKVLSRLELGQAVCGTVAQIREPIYVNDVQSQKDKMTRLIRKLGIGTYACHPLIVAGRLYGTLSFGSRSRSQFELGEIEILKTFCNLVAEAIARKKGEEAVRQTEAKFRTVFDLAPTGVAMSLIDGSFLDANPTYCEITGYNLDELKKLNANQLLHSDDYAENIRLMDQLIAGEMDHQVAEKRYVRKDGRIVWVRRKIALVRSPQGEEPWMIRLIEDITDRKQMDGNLVA